MAEEVNGSANSSRKKWQPWAPLWHSNPASAFMYIHLQKAQSIPAWFGKKVKKNGIFMASMIPFYDD